MGKNEPKCINWLCFEFEPKKYQKLFISNEVEYFTVGIFHWRWVDIFWLSIISGLDMAMLPVVRMAEWSKAPDSSDELACLYIRQAWVFWSTNVGVGSNPTSDKPFSVSIGPNCMYDFWMQCNVDGSFAMQQWFLIFPFSSHTWTFFKYSNLKSTQNVS